MIIVLFTLTVVNYFRCFLSQFSTNSNEIVQALLPSHEATTLFIEKYCTLSKISLLNVVANVVGLNKKCRPL